MTPGTVRFYNARRGFGFVQPVDGRAEIFIHATALHRAGMLDLVEGQKVLFDAEVDSCSGKTFIRNIQAT
jgi:CspA family cold shock protein